jgi:hypothetical protein
MRLYAFSGRPSEALAQYERLREVLSRHLGTEPGGTTCRLRDEKSAGSFPPTQLAADPPAEQLPDAGKHNLPEAVTSFVGREREMVDFNRTLAMTQRKNQTCEPLPKVCWSGIYGLGSIEIGSLGPLNTLPFDHKSGSPESQLDLLPDINKP